MSTISTAHRPSFLLLWNTCVQNSGSIQFGSVHFSGCELSFMCVCLTQSVQLTLSGGISKHTFSRQHSVFSNGPYSGKLQCLQLIYVTNSTVQMFYLLTSISGIGGRGVLCVCARACLSVREHISGTTRSIFTIFLCMLPTAVARSSSGGVAICYVLPVLWMTLYWHMMDHLDSRRRSL